jgi:general secretion pathway protein K
MMMHRGPASRNINRNGSALLVVLIMLGVIAFLAAAVARSISSAALELSAAHVSSEAESDLRAGIELGVAAILNLGDEMRSADVAVDLRDRRIAVRVTNERARIDLNKAKADVLTGLFKTVGLDDTEAASLADNVVNWRGGDASQKPAAPQQDHQSLGAPPRSFGFDTPMDLGLKEVPKQTPGSRFFFHPIQLVSVPGFSIPLVERLFPFLTIANGADKVNPFIAAPAVLNAMPGASPANVDAFLDARSGNVGRDTAILLLGVDKKLLSEDAASGWRLQITSTQRGLRPHHSEAVVATLESDRKQPYRVLYVIDDAGELAVQARY